MDEGVFGADQVDGASGQNLNCDQVPISISSLAEMDTHKEDRPYKCNQCDKSYRHAGSLVNHKKTHQIGLYSCLICQKEYSNPMGLKSHLRTHSEEKRFQCDQCGEAFRMSQQLYNHRKSLHSFCSMSNGENLSSQKYEVQSPVLMENSNLMSNLENYIAESMVPVDFSQLVLKYYPEEKSQDEGTAKEDVEGTRTLIEEKDELFNTNTDEYRYKCNQCGKAYKHAGSLANHKQSHMVGVYQCAICYKEFSNLMAMKNHCRLHSDSRARRSFKTPRSSAKVAGTPTGSADIPQTDVLESADLMEKHEEPPNIAEVTENNNVEHDVEKIPLPDLHHQVELGPDSLSPLSKPNHDVTNTTFCLDSMLQSSSNESMVELQENKIAHNPSVKIKHETGQCHAQQQQYDATYEEEANAGDLENRPFKCQECGKSYRHAGSLINHKKTHQTGVYNCSLCSKQMFNMAALKNHLRAHFKSRAGRKLEDAYFHSANFSELFQNPEDPYQCGICGEMLTNESDFLQHQVLHQKEEAKDTSCEDQHMEEVPESDICWQEHPQASHGSSDDSAYSSGPGMPDTIKTEVENLPLQQWSQEESLAITPEIKTENSGPVLQNASTGFEQLPDDQIVAKEEESCGLKDQPPIDRPYKCESCERTYRHKSSLINHKLTHKIGVYQCSICPKQYTNLMALRNHLRFHSRSYAGRRGLTSRLSHHFFRGKPRFLQNKSMHSVVESVKLNDKISPQADIDVAGAEASLKESQIHCRCGKSFNCSGDFQTHRQICHNAMPASYAELPADLHGEVSTLTDAREVVFKTKALTEPQGNVPEASEHQGRRVYECDLCEKSYRHSGSLINHKRTHQTGDYMCPYCSKHIHNLAALKNHIRIHHKIKKSQLGQESDNSRFLFSDMCFPHEGKDMFGCVSCEETFHSEDDLVAHQMVHMALEEDLWDHQAPECSTPNHNKDDTLRDIRDYEWEHSSISNFHGDEIKDLGSAGEDIKPVDYTCVECGEVYESVDDLNNHKHTHQTGIYQCSFCPKEYPNLLALRSHFQSHTKPQALRNSGRKTLDGSEGNEFMDNQPSVDNRYDCGHCGLIFSNEVDFHQHQVAHEKQVMDESLPGLHAEGQESELSFPMHSSERELLRRIKSEMEETDPSEIADGGSLLSHICGFCGKTYDDLESLKVHSLSHTAEEVPFANENDHPDTDFKEKSLQQSLKEEESSGETAKNEGSPESRPYTCEQCGKTYRHGGSLVNHKKTHLVGNFQCVACSRQYPNLAAYRNHLRHHPDCKQQAALNGSHELQASNLNDTIFPCGDGVQLNSCPPSSITLSDLSSFHVLSTDLKPSRDSESKLNSHLHSSPPQIQCQSPVKHVKSASKRSSRRAGRRSKTVNSQPTDPRSTSVSVSLSMSDVEDKSVQICEFCGKMFFGVKDLALHLSGNCDRSNHSEKAGSSLVEQRTEGKDDLLPSLSGLIQSQNQGETGFHQRPFRCEVCGRSYRHAGSLINHKQTHKTGIFRCSICQKRFFNLMAMKNHNRIHFELKRHKCLDCGKAFRLHKQLDTHQRIHRQRAAARKPGRRNRRSMKYRKVVQWQQQKSSINVSNQRSSEDTSVDQGNGGVKKNADAKVKSAMDPNFRPYQCEECGRSYRHAGSLFNHKKSHKMGQYCCSICDKTYSNLMAMKNHQRTHYEAKRHHCSLCGKTFRWKRQLFRHQLAHVQEGSQSGSPLPSGAEEASLVDGHQAESSSVSCKKSRITSEHTSSNIKESKLSNDLFSSFKPVCQACGNLFTSYDELENHSCKESRTDMVASGNEGAGDPTSSQEEDGRPYQCNVCGRTYRHAGSLLNHKNTHETGLYKCSICHKQFSNPMAIKNHLRTHTAERRFQCTDCGKAFRSSRELICHNRVHTGEKPFHCPTCNRGFSRKLTLRHHQRTHKQLTFSSQSSSLVLPTDKETESNENNTSESSEELQNQVAPTTKDERKYKCNQCERSYRHAGSLFNHQKTHRTGVYKCPNCLKEYFNLLAFKNHLRIHKYPCKDCGRAFRISSHLAAHRKIHEQEGPLSCLLCNKHFFCRSSFEQHQLTHNSPSSDALEPQAVANFMVEVT